MRIISNEQMQQMLAAVHPHEDLFGVRDRAMLVLAYHTGLRVSELVGLSVDDVCANGVPRQTLHVRASLAKYAHSRNIPLNVSVQEAIQTVLRFNKSHGFSVAPAAPLLVGKYHHRISTRYVQLLVARLRKKAGLDVPATPHSLRHCFASRIVEKTGNVLIASRLLGHRCLETVTIYAHTSPEQLAAAVSLLAG